MIQLVPTPSGRFTNFLVQTDRCRRRPVTEVNDQQLLYTSRKREAAFVGVAQAHTFNELNSIQLVINIHVGVDITSLVSSRE